MNKLSSIREVAKLAGVSTGSVSRYLNGQTLKVANMEKIATAINQLNYKENIIAKGLKNNRSFSVGLLMNNLSSRLSADIVASIEALMEANGYSLFLSCFNGEAQLVSQKIDYLLSHSIDGLILFEADETWPGMEKLVELTIPIISLNTPNRLENVDSILVNDRKSVRETIEQMIAMGHQSIGVITAPQTEYVARERLAGALEAKKYSEKEITIDVYTGDYSRLSGFYGAKELLAKNITALFVCNYNMSIGALEYFNKSDQQIDQEIYFAHYDYFNELQTVLPERIIIQQPAVTIGELCGKRLIERMENQHTSGQTILLENKIYGMKQNN